MASGNELISSGARRARLAAAAPPVMHEVVDDLAELADRAALAHEVARGRVERHHAVADTPAPLTFRVQPDDSLHALADEPERPRLRIVVVVTRVAEYQDRRLAVERVELALRELAEGESEVGPAVVVDRRALERPLDGALDRVGVEGLGHLGDLGHEHVRADPAEALLEAPDQLQHEARGVADRVRDVADRDQLFFSRCRRLRKISIGTPPYCKLFRVVRRASSRPRCSCRRRSASASSILRARRATTFFIWAISSGVSAKSGLSASTSRVSFSPCRYARRSSSRSTCWRIIRLNASSRSSR